VEDSVHVCRVVIAHRDAVHRITMEWYFSQKESRLLVRQVRPDRDLHVSWTYRNAWAEFSGEVEDGQMLAKKLDRNERTVGRVGVG